MLSSGRLENKVLLVKNIANDLEICSIVKEMTRAERRRYSYDAMIMLFRGSRNPDRPYETDA